ncbi:MAG: glycosyltransferase family 4 protein [Gammaproteobacteria bacterium]
MNILGICLSPGKGGLELYAHRAIRALQLAGHDCHFAIQPGSFLRQLEWQIPLIELRPAFRNLPLVTARRLARYIDAHKIDIIHMHWNKDLNLVALAKALSRRKPRLVYTRHMEITRSKLDPYHRILYAQVNRLLVISRFVENQAFRYLPLARDQVSLLYIGVAETMPASDGECNQLIQDDNDRKDKFVIGMIGRIEYGKGQHVLIEAVSLLNNKNSGLQVVMAGPINDGKYFEQLNQQIQDKQLNERVKYLGVSRDPGKLMSCCDVVVLTTYCETFGLTLVEAMRAGTAVIGSRAGGVLEIIIRKPGDADQIGSGRQAVCR